MRTPSLLLLILLLIDLQDLTPSIFHLLQIVHLGMYILVACICIVVNPLIGINIIMVVGCEQKQILNTLEHHKSIHCYNLHTFKFYYFPCR